MTKDQGEKKGMRGRMPVIAAWVDELRAALGAEQVDAAIAAGQRAARQAAQIEAAEGKAAAQAWLQRQRWPAGRFWAEEGGHTVGVRMKA